MVELSSRERLQPSLLDRLTDDAPERRRETLDQQTLSMQQLRRAVLRDLAWLLNTTNLGAVQDLTLYPEVRTSVLNYGVPDLAGKTLTMRVIQGRAREIRDAIRAFEPRMNPKRLEVEALPGFEKENAVTYVIRGDITAAVQAMPVEFKTDIEVDTASVTVRE